MDKLKYVFESKPFLLLVGLGGIVLVALMFMNKPSTAVEARPAEALQELSTLNLDTTIQVYPEEAKLKLKLPKKVRSNKAKHVLAATDIPASRYERTVSSVFDEDSGEVTQFVIQKPLPLFSKASESELGIYLGFYNLDPAVRLSYSQNLFAVKAIKFKAYVSADLTQTNVNTFAGIGASYEW